MPDKQDNKADPNFFPVNNNAKESLDVITGYFSKKDASFETVPEPKQADSSETMPEPQQANSSETMPEPQQIDSSETVSEPQQANSVEPVIEPQQVDSSETVTGVDAHEKDISLGSTTKPITLVSSTNNSGLSNFKDSEENEEVSSTTKSEKNLITNTKTLFNQNLTRLKENGAFRVIVCAVGLFLFFIVILLVKCSGNDQQSLDSLPDSKGADIPTTTVKPDQLNSQQMAAKEARDLQNAKQANKTQASYIPSISQQASATDDFGSAPSLNSSTTIAGTPNPNNVPNTNGQSSVSTMPPPTSESQINVYKVQPLGSSNFSDVNSSSGSTSQENNSQTNENGDPSLNHIVEMTDEWQKNYLAIRQKKADAVDNRATTEVVEKYDKLMKAFSIEPQKHELPPSSKDGSNFSKVYFSNVNANKSTPNNNSSNVRNLSGETNDITATANKPLKTEQPLIRAGETATAILITDVNTDEGSEVMAKFTSGALKGATLVGTVNQQTNNIQFIFTKVFRKNADTLTISASARQVGTNSLGMADSVNHHYGLRYASLAATSVLSGIGQAFEQTSGSNASASNGVVISQSSDPSAKRILGNAVGEMGENLSSDIQQVQNRPTTYKANSGKVIKIFFNDDVRKD